MMTTKKCREVLDLYEPFVTSDYTRMVNSERIDHLASMIPKMRVMLDEVDYRELKMLPHDPHREKFMRWLGFMQGVLYAEGLFTIDEMKQHNRPDGES